MREIKRNGGRMKIIKIKSQKEFNALPEGFDEYTEIRIVETTIKTIESNPKNSCFVLDSSTVQRMSGSSTVQRMSGSSTVQRMLDSSTVQRMWGSNTVQRMSDSSTVQEMLGSSIVQEMLDSSTVQRMWGSSTVQEMLGSSTVQRMLDSSTVQRMWDSSTVQRMLGSSTVQEMWDSSTVQRMLDSSTVQRMLDSSTVVYISMNAKITNILDISVKILEAKQQAIIVYQDCDGSPSKKDTTVHIIKTKKSEFTLENFIKIYDVQKKSKNKLILYKFVQHDFTDFYSGKTKYEVGKTVTAIDWNPDNSIECGGGLHLCPSIDYCKKFNNSKNGHALQCEVNIKDILVHSNPLYPHKIRCKQCKVIKER